MATLGIRKGGSRGGARPPPPLSLDQTKARRAEKIFLGGRPGLPYLRVWMTAPAIYLKVWIC